MKRYIASSRDDPKNYKEAGYPAIDNILDMIDYIGGYGPAVSGYIEQLHQYLYEISLIEWIGDDPAMAKKLGNDLKSINDHLEYAIGGLYDIVNLLYKEAKRQDQ